MESLEFMVAQSWVALSHEFTSSTETNLEGIIFLTETES